jgi:hypothetical protein
VNTGEVRLAFAAAAGPLKHGVAPRSWKSGDAIPRRESDLRDPYRSNQQQRCMPRWQASVEPLLAAAAQGMSESPISRRAEPDPPRCECQLNRPC